jgi:hypothetical protein
VRTPSQSAGGLDFAWPAMQTRSGLSLARAGDVRPGPLVLAPVRIPAATKRGTVRAAPYHAGSLFGQRSHHRITIDPAAASDQAIGSYAKVGFRAVGADLPSFRPFPHQPRKNYSCSPVERLMSHPTSHRVLRSCLARYRAFDCCSAGSGAFYFCKSYNAGMHNDFMDPSGGPRAGGRSGAGGRLVAHRGPEGSCPMSAGTSLRSSGCGPPRRRGNHRSRLRERSRASGHLTRPRPGAHATPHAGSASPRPRLTSARSAVTSAGKSSGRAS